LGPDDDIARNGRWDMEVCKTVRPLKAILSLQQLMHYK
jgi:hypothetical protein